MTTKPLTYRTSAPETATAALSLLAGGLLLFHLFANAFTAYGYFRDEFYYLACSHHLAAGYVDHPPLSVWLLAMVRTLFGDSLFVVRLVPALAVSGTVVFTGLVVQQMGGRTWATVLAGLSVALAPIFMAMGTFYSMNSLDMLLWSAAAYQVLRIVHSPAPRGWMILGVVMGLALLNKISFLWFGAGLLVGILATPLRTQLRTPWPYAAGGVAMVFFLPFIIWNLQHDVAHLEFMQGAMQYKYNGITRIDFLEGVFLLMNPATVLIWLAGLYFYFVAAVGYPYRILGFIFLVTVTILLVNGHSKPEYAAPAFPLLWAGGGVFIEQIATRKGGRWIPVVVAAVLVPTVALAPLAVPLLPPATYVKYTATLGMGVKNTEGKETAELSQFYADMFGWEELAANVSAVYRALPEAEQAQTSVFAQNYGEAAALDHYRGRPYPLPRVMSGHNNYWLWGYGDQEPEVVIIIGGNQEDHQESFEQVDSVAVHRAPYAMPYENNLTLYVGRGRKAPASEVWPRVKHYD